MAKKTKLKRRPKIDPQAVQDFIEGAEYPAPPGRATDETSKRVNERTSKRVRVRASSKALKTRTSFNLSDKLLVDLAEAQLKLRRKGAGAVSKSAIVEVALRQAIADLDAVAVEFTRASKRVNE